MTDQAAITAMLDEVRSGKPGAMERLLPIVYESMKAMARGKLRQFRGHDTMNTTALVHEAFIKLSGSKPDWENRVHFFGVASRAMRQVLVDAAKHKQRAKRGGGIRPSEFNEGLHLSDEQADHVVALDEALVKLEEINPKQVRIVECRFFVGLNEEETAEALGVSRSTITREWRAARTWLYQHMVSEGDLEPDPKRMGLS